MQQRTRICVSDVSTLAVEGQPMCAVNTDDLESGKDHTLQCVGPSELIFVDGNGRKFCERIIEKQSIFCPGKEIFYIQNLLSFLFSME